VGQSAFTHKAGLHTSAIARRKDLYEHVAPEGVGNASRVTVSELSGRSTVQMKAEELGLDLDAVALVDVLEKLKALEYQGYHFEVADGSLELLMRESGGWRQAFFRLESFRVITEQREDGKFVAEATIKVHIGDERVVATAEGNGPVNALDAALRQALGKRFPSVNDVHLTDYKVRVLDTSKGTGAVTRVLLDSTGGDRTWSTIGVSSNIIEASWEALSDSYVYGLLHNEDSTPDAADPQA
ncbi:MAG: citramalate synthase, partial [Actinobacteria bacterium]|nr:citramalate synthase [Actinomycetota bacterium]